MPVIEERVDRLERIVEEFVASVGVEFNKLYNSQMRTEAELGNSRTRCTILKDEMRGFKDENRLQDKADEYQVGRDRKKLGTITEDLVAPSIPRIIKEGVWP